MHKHLWLNSSIISKALGEDGELKITGYASTSNRDRVGDIILPSAWTKGGGLENYKKNPIILFNHNYSAPIGKATELEVDENGLRITAIISKGTHQYQLIKDEVLRTFSVGFMMKTADYDEEYDSFIITDAELLETSVVTVPCNQDATFSLSKNFDDSADDIKQFRDSLKKELKGHTEQQDEVNTSDTDELGEVGEDELAAQGKIKTMDPDEIKRLAEEAATAAAARIAAEQKAVADAAIAAAAEKAAQEASVKTTVEAAVKSNEEKLLAEFDNRLKANNEDLQKTFEEMKSALEEKSAELNAMRTSKRVFDDRGTGNGDWQKAFEQDIDDAFILGRVTGNRKDNSLVTSLIEKVNQHSSVVVSSDLFETTASRNVERDIQNELIIAPLFREIAMNSANLTIPIMPDAGYAEITANQAPSGTSPKGSLDPRGATYGAPYDGITMQEITLNTVKMIAKSYLGNETEEDAIIPILPLIRESMIRQHARGVDNMILAGNDADGVYTAGAKDGLLKLARTGSRMLTTAAVATPLTAAALLSMRKAMGKYGLRPDDVVYIVSQNAYFELLQDAEFQDADLVGSIATKLTGEVGRLYGSKVLMSDEFAPAGAGKFHALALNTRNFVVPRLRGVTVESEYSVENQRRVLVTSQRLGFAEIISGATSVVGQRYALS